MIALSHNKIKLKKKEFSQASQLIKFDISNALNERMFQKSTSIILLHLLKVLKIVIKIQKKSLRIFISVNLNIATYLVVLMFLLIIHT